jgi:hypothetical protein
LIEREAAAIQKSLFGEDRQPDWLFWNYWTRHWLSGHLDSGARFAR